MQLAPIITEPGSCPIIAREFDAPPAAVVRAHIAPRRPVPWLGASDAASQSDSFSADSTTPGWSRSAEACRGGPSMLASGVGPVINIDDQPRRRGPKHHIAGAGAAARQATLAPPRSDLCL